MGFFALRCGVSLKRAARVIDFQDDKMMQPLLSCLNVMGERYTERFVSTLDSLTTLFDRLAIAERGYATIRIVSSNGLALPRTQSYGRDWLSGTYKFFGGEKRNWVDRSKCSLSEGDVRPRFTEHVLHAIEMEVPPTGPLVEVVTEGMDRGWISRDSVVEASFAAMKKAGRTGDRKRLMLLFKKVNLSVEELTDQLPHIVHYASMSEAPVVEQLALPLLPVVSEDKLVDLALPCLYVSTAKAKRNVLKALQKRDKPGEGIIEELSPAIGELAQDDDEKVADAASALLSDWGAPTNASGMGDSEVDAGSPRDPLWQPTPELWTVPRFTYGDSTPHRLAELMSELSTPYMGIADITVERFLACLIDCASQDVDICRQVLASAPRRVWDGYVKDWACGPHFDSRSENYQYPKGERKSSNHVADRHVSVFKRLGEIPCLVSTPSFDDLSISGDDLATRVKMYDRLGLPVAAADLYIALARLDLSSNVPLDVQSTNVAVLHHDGETLGKDAGTYILEHVRAYTSDADDAPITPLASVPEEYDCLPWPSEELEPAPIDSFRTLTRLFPNACDHTMEYLAWYPEEINIETSAYARQVVNRATPLPPSAAANIFGVQRPGGSYTEQASIALDEAWERGLLIPGVADYYYMDWCEEKSGLALLADVLLDASERGMLSVTWPLLDDVLGNAAEATRVPQGAHRAAVVMQQLLAEVRSAVERGDAPASSLDLPGARAMAARKGSSKGVKQA